jgi:hypothetical protein
MVFIDLGGACKTTTSPGYIGKSCPYNLPIFIGSRSLVKKSTSSFSIALASIMF